MFKGNFLDRCSICWIALLESFNRLLHVPVVTSFFDTVRYLLLPFLGKKTLTCLLSTRYFLRDAVSKICCHVKPVFNLQSNLPWVSDRPKCTDLEVTCGRWSFTRIKPQGVSSKRKSRHFYFKEDNSLHVNSKVRYVYWYVVTKRSSCTLNSIV